MDDLQVQIYSFSFIYNFYEFLTITNSLYKDISNPLTLKN